MPYDPVADARREWWWSPQPFWKYTAGGSGWSGLVDKHPGMFNLAWVMSGVHQPPKDYRDFAPRLVWVYTESGHIPMLHGTMADMAFKLDLPSFLICLKAEKHRLKRWKFHDQEMSYEQILGAVEYSAATRA